MPLCFWLYRFGLIFLLIMVVGCTTKTGYAQAQGAAAMQAATSSDSLVLTQWHLIRWVTPTGAKRPLSQSQRTGPSSLSIAFFAQGENYRVSGFSGCNHFSGTYQLHRGGLRIIVPAAGRMHCAIPARAKLERAYLNGLDHIAHFTLDSGGAPHQMALILQNGDTLNFMRGEDLPNR